jgi:hypothetical protein
MGKKGSSYGVLVRKAEVKTSLGRPTRREEDNIKLGFQKTG